MADIKKQVEDVLSQARIHLKADGGDVELVDVSDEGVVKVRLKGACARCPMSRMTFAHFVEENLKKTIPSVKKVESV